MLEEINDMKLQTLNLSLNNCWKKTWDNLLQVALKGAVETTGIKFQTLWLLQWNFWSLCNINKISTECSVHYVSSRVSIHEWHCLLRLAHFRSSSDIPTSSQLVTSRNIHPGHWTLLLISTQASLALGWDTGHNSCELEHYNRKILTGSMPVPADGVNVVNLRLKHTHTAPCHTQDLAPHWSLVTATSLCCYNVEDCQIRAR